MASMAGVVNTFSTQTSMAAPINRDRTASVNAGKRDAYTVSERWQTEAERAFVRRWHPGRFYRDVPDGSSGSRGRLACLRQAGKSTPHPAYGSELSTGGGRLVRA